jgi:hypothetical protein
MFRKLIIIIFFFLSFFVKAQEEYVKIDINKNILLANNPIKQLPFKKVIEERIGIEVESYDFTKKSDSMIYTNLHPFIAALHYAFADHRPVIISPDMIWLLINQSFAIHINQNPEKYRKRFVNFKGKKSISIIRNDFRKGAEKNPWIKVFPVFSDSIKKYIGDSIYHILVPKFSTTSIIEQSAYEISLMDFTGNYFDFSAQTFCGIPYIKLQGKPEDWKWILDHLEFFDSFDLSFWTSKIKPIINEIYLTSMGEQNTNFWKNIYKWHQSSGGHFSDGWITNFFLYTFADSGNYKINKMLSINLDSILAAAENPEIKYHELRMLKLIGLEGKEFPDGLSKVDFKWDYRIKPANTYSMELVAGFMGISQDKKTFELKPIISYAIIDKTSEKVKSENSKVIDRGYPACDNTFDYFEKNINQPPIFQPNINNNDSHKSHKSFEELLKQKLEEKYPNKEELIYIEIKFTITSAGDIIDLVIDSKLNQEKTDFLKELIMNTKSWRPAIINDGPSDYKLILDFKY